jgi:hypothetical protein
MLLWAEQGRAPQGRIVHIVDERRNRHRLWVVECVGIKELLRRDGKRVSHVFSSFHRQLKQSLPCALYKAASRDHIFNGSIRKNIIYLKKKQKKPPVKKNIYNKGR